MLQLCITIMVLKWLKFSHPTNKKINACMRKEKKFQNSGKIKKYWYHYQSLLLSERESPNDIIGVSP